MIRFLSLSQIMLLHQRLIKRSGGASGLRDIAALESALAQPKMTFDQKELYPSLAEKAAALGYSLIKNHPFLDGNKRLCHAAMDVFLVLNGYEIEAPVSEQEKMVIQLAEGKITQAELVGWLEAHIVAFK